MEYAVLLGSSESYLLFHVTLALKRDELVLIWSLLRAELGLILLDLGLSQSPRAGFTFALIVIQNAGGKRVIGLMLVRFHAFGNLDYCRFLVAL